MAKTCAARRRDGRSRFPIRHRARTPSSPIKSLLAGNTFGTHDDVFGPSDADHLLQARGAARSGYLSKLLLRQRIEDGFGRDAEIAGERQFEADAEAIAAIGGDDGL